MFMDCQTSKYKEGLAAAGVESNQSHSMSIIKGDNTDS